MRALMILCTFSKHESLSFLLFRCFFSSSGNKNGCQILHSWRPPGKSSSVGNASPWTRAVSELSLTPGSIEIYCMFLPMQFPGYIIMQYITWARFRYESYCGSSMTVSVLVSPYVCANNLGTVVQCIVSLTTSLRRHFVK